MGLGNKIREIRTSKGVKQSFVSKALGRNSSWLSRIESDKQQPTAEDLFKISQLLNTDMKNFFCP